MHSIKLARARSLSRIGNYPRSAAAMESHLPKEVIAQCNSAALAAMLDALWATAQEAKGLAEAEACDQGYIWDARRGAMRDIST